MLTSDSHFPGLEKKRGAELIMAESEQEMRYAGAADHQVGGSPEWIFHEPSYAVAVLARELEQNLTKSRSPVQPNVFAQYTSGF